MEAKKTRANALTYPIIVMIVIISLSTVTFFSQAWPGLEKVVEFRRHPSSGERIILISLDGFRHDYFNYLDENSALKTLARDCVHIGELQPCFPTFTFPNHYSLATGVFPESHGIVANHFYDPDSGLSFSPANCSQPEWWLSEPIWVTAERQNRSAFVISWPGSDVIIKGYRPTEYRHYNGSTPFERKIDGVVRWASEETPALIMAYFEQPDLAGHRDGPHSEGVRDAVRNIDRLIGNLVERLDSRMNLVLVSDHGMAESGIGKQKQINLDPFLKIEDISKLRFTSQSPVLHFHPQPDLFPVLLDQLLLAQAANPNISVYEKYQIPERYHYRNSKRIGAIVVVADPGFEIISAKLGHGTILNRGNHGFDNTHPDMQGFLIASGPAFARKKFISSMRNLEVYRIICHVLGIVPAPNNGSLSLPAIFR